MSYDSKIRILIFSEIIVIKMADISCGAKVKETSSCGENEAKQYRVK